MTISAVVLGLAFPIIICEFTEVSPWLARCLLTWAAGKLGDVSRTERYREEWLAGLEDVPGKLIKLIRALSIVCYMIPIISWRINHKRYMWPLRRLSDFVLILFPSKRSDRLETLIMTYHMRFVTINQGCNLGVLVQTVHDAIDALVYSRSPIRRFQMAIRENVAIKLDHKLMRFEIRLLDPTE